MRRLVESEYEIGDRVKIAIDVEPHHDFCRDQYVPKSNYEDCVVLNSKEWLEDCPLDESNPSEGFESWEIEFIEQLEKLE